MTLPLVLAALGTLIVGCVAIDQIWTTLAVGIGAGPFSGRLVDSLWRLALRHHPSKHPHLFLGRLGLPILLTTIGAWVGFLWLGWSLVFSAVDSAVISSATHEQGSIADRVYFAGYTLMTLGNGDFKPVGTFFQLATVAASASGFFVVTLSITYLVPIVSAVVQRRQLASMITALGRTPEEIVIAAWAGDGFRALPLQLVPLAASVSLVSQQHTAYPVLRAFRGSRRDTATTPAVATLSEAVMLFSHAVVPQHRPPQEVLRSLASAIDAYEHALPLDAPADGEPPPGPRLAALCAAGVPTVEDDQFAPSLQAAAHQRIRMAALVRSAGWQWTWE